MTTWKIGELIQNRWEIHKILGGAESSGMGIVYLVYDYELKDIFAVKTFQQEALALHPKLAERFKQEASAWVNLDAHPNVVQARFVQTVEGRPLLFLEYVHGGDLSRWIGLPRLTENLSEVLRLAVQCCDGMNHILAKGIVAHRDIKPANCLLTLQQNLKVTDFGLSKVFEEMDFGARPWKDSGSNSSERFTVTGAGAGTPPYMAPEQFVDAKNVDVRADIYAFGVMLFEMVEGRLPFAGRSWQEWQRQHRDQAPPALGPCPLAEAEARRHLQELIHACLAKVPGDRPGSFTILREWMARLHCELTGKEVPSPVDGNAPSAAELCNKGMSLNELGLKEEALAACEAALRMDPRSELAWLNKGVVLAGMNHKEEALAAYSTALRINPCFARAWSNMGVVLADLGRRAEALEACDAALRKNPRSEPAWLNKGVVLSSLGGKLEALAAYAAALEINPRFEQAWSNKGVVLADLGRKNEALASYETALEINPQYEKAWSNKGAVLADLGRNEEALAACETALRINPRLEGAWSNKGQVLAELGRTEEALACFQTAILINPRFAPAWMGKGELFLSSGLVRKALASFEQAQELGDGKADRAIALCRQRLGNEEAIGSRTGQSGRCAGVGITMV